MGGKIWRIIFSDLLFGGKHKNAIFKIMNLNEWNVDDEVYGVNTKSRMAYSLQVRVVFKYTL